MQNIFLNKLSKTLPNISVVSTLVATVSLLVSSAVAASSMEEAQNKLYECYARRARTYAVEICMPPNQLLATIYAACTDLEKAARSAALHDPRFRSLSVEVLEREDMKAREEWLDGQIEKTIVDTRIGTKLCIN